LRRHGGSIHPNQDETCNGIDDNCDGQADEGLDMVTYFSDNDRDGYGEGTTGSESCNRPRTRPPSGATATTPTRT